MNIIDLSAVEIRSQIAHKKLSSREVTSAFLDQIYKEDKRIKAFISVFEKDACAQADAIDARIASGEDPGKLAGVPIAVKDNICIKSKRTTCASKILQNYIAPYDAHVVELLKQEGAVILGKTNLDEFAMGSSTENSGFFATRNPWNIEYTPGGSSGGSAAAVAARMTPWAIGSDTGGSIRQPASYCGVVGMKPTYGNVSRYGLIAFGSSLDQIGPFARTAADTAYLLSVISGYDCRDSTSLKDEIPDYPGALNINIKRLKIGVPKEYVIEGLDQEVRVSLESAKKLFEKLGAQIMDISLPHTCYAVAVYYIIAPSEASANLARYDGVKYGHRSSQAANLLEMYEKSRAEGFGTEVKRRIMLGTYALSAGYYDAYYAKAQKVRRLIQQDFTECFKKVDLILTPTAPTPAFKIGEKLSDPLTMYLSDIFTISSNLAGIPSISIPGGFTGQKLPIGLQLISNMRDEGRLLTAAHAFQLQTAYHLEKPG
ncbi:MAG: Asp-tRNA(Asn)/Glu-tRNA(Gln) amidotransferase subunit GatA [bacterium]